MTIVQALKKLGKKFTGGTAPSGKTISDVLLDIESKWSGSGSDGASVTAINLTVDENGAVTGGTATLSDTTEVTITVTTVTPDGEGD